MNYVDIVIIAVIALYALLGLWRGFGKTTIKFLCFGLAVLATWLIVGSVTNWLLSVGFINNFITGENISLSRLYYSSFGEEILYATAETKLGGAMGLYINPMIVRYTAIGGPAAYGLTYAEFISVNLAVNTLSIILCVLLYIVIRLVAMILGWLLKKIFCHGDNVGVVSRLLGFVVGAARGVALVMVLLIVSTVIFPLGFAQPYTKSVSEGIIANFSAKYTYIAFDAAIYGGEKNTEKTENWLKSAGFNKGEYDVTEPSLLQDKKDEAISALGEYRNGKGNENYTEGGIAKLDAAKQAGETAINAAETVEAVTEALDNAKAALDAVLTSEQETAVNTKAEAAKNELNALKTEKVGAAYDADTCMYSKAQYDVIAVAHSEGTTAIDNAKAAMSSTSSADIDAALETAKAAINGAKTLKQEYTDQLNEFYNTKNENWLDTDTKNRMTVALSEGTVNIAGAETPAAIKDAYDAAVARITEIYDSAARPAEPTE